MSVSPKAETTEAERKFVVKYLATNNKAGSYKEAFPKECAELTAQQIDTKSNSLLNKDYIQRFIVWMKETSTKEKAYDTLNDAIVVGSDKEAKAASDAVLKLNREKKFDLAVLRWVKVMSDIGAEVVIPLGENQEHVIPLKQMIDEGKFRTFERETAV